jgi:hypothetical protein
VQPDADHPCVATPHTFPIPLTSATVTLNDHTLFEHVLDDEIFLGVVGMLEYDPEFPTYKANYREFLQQATRFHEPIELGDVVVQKKVHATYRLQFLKDVVLARALDDSTFNVLSSLIIFNQIDIIQHVQNDARILERVVAAFTDENTARGEPLALDSIVVVEPQPNGAEGGGAKAADGLEPVRRWEKEKDAHRCAVLMLVQQLCAMGKNVQLPARIQLFKALADRGLATSVQWALSLPERDEEARRMMAAAGEVLSALLDHALDGVREFVWRKQLGVWDLAAAERAKRKEEAKDGQGPPKQAETLLLVMCRTMASSRDLAVQSMLGDALKVVLELPPAEPDVQVRYSNNLFLIPALLTKVHRRSVWSRLATDQPILSSQSISLSTSITTAQRLCLPRYTMYQSSRIITVGLHHHEPLCVTTYVPFLWLQSLSCSLPAKRPTCTSTCATSYPTLSSNTTGYYTRPFSSTNTPSE